MKFSKNWKKLSEPYFTTIRKNTGRYRLGSECTINAPRGKFKAYIIGLMMIKKEDITDMMAKYDAETDRNGLISMLEGWYGKTFNDYILITLKSEVGK